MLSVDIITSRDSIVAREKPQLFYSLIRVQPPEQFIITRMPLNISLVIDRSTSMKGERLDQVKRAAMLIIDKLATNDIFSVVTYSDRAEVVLPASRVTNKTPIIARIQGVLASGGTEIKQGLTAGINEIRKSPLSAHLNHLILLTDGHTYGDDDECIALVETASRRNIGMSAFGIGHEWNDQFLDDLVTPSGGQSAFIETPRQIVEYLQQQIENLGTVYANNVTLNLKKMPAGVDLKYALKLSPFAQPIPIERNTLRLGTVEGQAPLLFLLEYNIDTNTPETTLRFTFPIKANIPTARTSNLTSDFYLNLPITKKNTPYKPPPLIIEAVRVLNLYRMNEKAWQDIEMGHIDKATKRMQHLTTRLLESGFTELATQTQLETQRLQTMGELTDEGRKQIKYGTRSLVAQRMSMDQW